MLRLGLLHVLAVYSIWGCGLAFADEIACNITTQPRVLTDYSGWFTSPNYPSAYPNLTNCQWLILSQEPEGIVRLDIGSIRTTVYVDRVIIYDGNTTSSPVIAAFDDTFTWDAVAENVRSSGPSMLVRFTSGAGNPTHIGFNASYTSTPLVLGDDPCYPLTRPKRLADGIGAFQSNGFPVSYWNYANCQWIIECQEPQCAVELTFPYLNTETNFDYITLYDGNSTAFPIISSVSGRYDASPPPGPFRSSGRSMFVRFSSDQTVLEPGFNATYAPLEPNECGTVLRPAPNTTVVGPGFDLMCYLDAVADVQFASYQCSDVVKNLPGIGDASSLVNQGGNFGCLLSTLDNFNGAAAACYDNYQWQSKLSNCASCNKMIVCIRFP